jgi:hypothetical protein
MTQRSPFIGLSAIGMAIGFNLPYLALAQSYDYPAVLRRPAGEALTLFSEGGAVLILTWHAFAWAALLFVPLSLGLALTAENRGASARLSIAAALTGALSGVTQSIGLWRWVFVVPDLAREYSASSADAAARAAAAHSFGVLNAYGGVAIGEHLGQWLLVFFMLSLSALQWRRGLRAAPAIGFLAAMAIATGTNEGIAIALGRAGDVFSLFTIGGFLGLTVWLIATGLVHLRPERAGQEEARRR